MERNDDDGQKEQKKNGERRKRCKLKGKEGKGGS